MRSNQGLSMSIGGETIPMTVQAEASHMTLDEAAASGLFDMPDEPGLVRIPVSVTVMIPAELLQPPEPLPGQELAYSPHDVPPEDGSTPSRRSFGNHPKAVAAQRIAETFKDTLRQTSSR